MKHFGLKQQDSEWFSAVLEKLGELSRKTIAQTNANPAEKVAWRLHEVNWSAKGVPYARKDLDWLDKDYLANEAEYPIQQFQITKALGRVIGFFDEQRVFNILFLDPLHNMQPSSFSDHKLRETIVTQSVSAGVLRYVEQQLAACKHDACMCRADYANLQKIATAKSGGTTLLVHVSSDLFLRVTQFVEDGAANSVAEVIEIAVASLEK